MMVYGVLILAQIISILFYHTSTVPGAAKPPTVSTTNEEGLVIPQQDISLADDMIGEDKKVPNTAIWSRVTN